MNYTKNKSVHWLLTQTGMMAQKESLVSSFTQGRTTHSSQMNDAEADELITWLRSQAKPSVNPANKMRRKILSMAHEMGWHTLQNGRYVADMHRINEWSLKYGYLHKPFNHYRHKELPRLVTQFENAYKTFINKV